MECIVPPIGGVTNLLVPVCISASHIAWAPIRTEVSFSMMGEAPGLIAALIVDQNSPAQRVRYADLRPLLNSINARLG
jgi:FAD dependent oxidoreductase